MRICFLIFQTFKGQWLRQVGEVMVYINTADVRFTLGFCCKYDVLCLDGKIQLKCKEPFISYKW